MRRHQYVVINRNAAGTLVAAVIDATSIDQAVAVRENELKTGGHHCELLAVTESVPGPYGHGGRLLLRVEPRKAPQYVPTNVAVLEL